jgi:hypothetical protein
MTSFLGLEVEQEKGQIRLHLDTYVNEMLEEYKAYIKRDLKPKKIPMQPGVVLTKDDAPKIPDPKEQKIYRSFVAKTQFVANWVRYDVSFAAAQFACFCASAGVWAALHHVMGYLNSNPCFKLVYWRGNYNGLNGFADSDWGNSESRRSTTGLLARYTNSIVLWRSRMQKTIALSTAEAEYYSASEIAVELEIIYLRNLIRNMGFHQDDDTPVYEDNTACIEWGNHIIGGRKRAKHIDILKHFAHEAIQNRHMRLIRVSTDEQLADIFTKALPFPQFERCLMGLMSGDLKPKGP